MRTDDLFGHVPQKGELAIEVPGDVGADRGVATGPIVHTPDTIRVKFLGHLDELRTATDAVPWTRRMLHSHRAMARYWAEWLPGGEGDGLLAEFRGELVRLGVEPLNPADGSPSY